MKKICFFLIFMSFGGAFSYSQTGFILQNDKKFDKIRFKLINNLIVIPVEINGASLSFILDTGVSKPIVFSFLKETDSLQINNTEAYFLRGLGEGKSFEALKSENNIFRIGNAIKFNQDMYAIHDANLNFTPQLGVPIHGLIGFDLFKDFVVEINYAARYIKLHDPLFYKSKQCKSCETINLEFYNNKPYLNAEVKVNNVTVPVKLLIDSGGSDALWLFEDDDLGLHANGKYFTDFLGHGLSGSVYGKRAKINEIHIKSFTLKDVNVSYPDSLAITVAKQLKERNGSIAGNVLKRFNTVFNYKKAEVILKKNKFYKEAFSYNKSGIELEYHGDIVVKEEIYTVNDYANNGSRSDSNTLRVGLTPSYHYVLKPAFVIIELRENSPAAHAGLLVGDVILNINNKDTHRYTLQEIMHLFYGRENDEIKLIIDRNGIMSKFNFNLKSPL
ncbi:PDZ domain-containing protein [Formosa sediminum]|uniref:PDZ domain-containing protein n=2 Tax=Formosa sediminum TaxID=2594004 RepID=A0A516GVX8_9FLAO|nr:PDZ domain-containing protein [Formosa sediminum]